jgi:carbon-monoxide dehydrogenase medium subunit
MWARPGLPSFDYQRAESMEEVARLLRERGTDVRLMMGGTDLLVRMRDGVLRPGTVIDVKCLPRMRSIEFDSQGGLRVGAAVTMNELANDPRVIDRYPLLAQAAGTVASYGIRNRATLGGNLCNASPAADTAPAVLLLDGRIQLFGSSGEREVEASRFFLGPGKSARQPDEILLGVRFPPLPPGCCGVYLKLGRNEAGDLAVVGAAVLGSPRPESQSGFGFGVALASVAPTPLLVKEVEGLLAAHAPGDEAFAEAAELAAQAACPIDDVRSGADYRRAMVRNLTVQGLRDVWARLRAGH